MAFNHVPGNRRTKQAGKVDFNLVSQAPELVGTVLNIWQFKLGQCPFHFPPGNSVTERFGQLSDKISGRGGQQFTALGA